MIGQAIAGARGFDTSSEQTMDRLLSTLLIEMDGISSSSSSSSGEHQQTNDMIIVIAATNHVSMLDDAILRPGRLDLHVEMPYPGVEAREAIWSHYLQKLPLDLEDQKTSATFSSVQHLAKDLANKTDDFSGADIQGICQEAALLSLREDSDKVYPRHIFTALQE